MPPPIHKTASQLLGRSRVTTGRTIEKQSAFLDARSVFALDWSLHWLQRHAAINAAWLGVSKSTVSRLLARAGLSLLSNFLPAEPVVRYEHEAPGDMPHIDTKKLGRIERPSHRVTGNRRDSVDGTGWETLFVAAIDDRQPT